MGHRHRWSLRPRSEDEQGVALIIALMSMALMMALGLALTLTTMTETRIAATFRQGAQALYAADAVVERVMRDLAVADWDAILNGAVTSAFVDGPAGGLRTLPDGSTFDLTEATNLLRCGKSACGSADVLAVTDERPWGPNNPFWQLYAYGPLDQMASAGTIDSRMYVIVWIADDPSESDGDPVHDGGPPVGCDPAVDDLCASANRGRGIIAMRAQALGPEGTRRAIEVTVSRGIPQAEASGEDSNDVVGQPDVRILSWREVR